MTASTRSLMGKFLLSILLSVGLSACGPVSEQGEGERAELSQTNQEASANFQKSLAETKEKVKSLLPASGYVDNSLIPTVQDLDKPPSFESVERLRIGAPWVFNDEVAPWFVGIEKGFFREAGLEIELEEGGPGRNMITLLLGQKIDIAVCSDAGRIPSALASPTGGGLVIVSTVLQVSPSGILGIDRATPKDQRSELKITPADLSGKRMGIQAGRDRLAQVYLRASGISKEQVEVVRNGSGPELLLVDRIDYMMAWIVNQPRLLEESGFNNWVFFPVSDHYYISPADINVVRKEMLDNRPHLVWRYNWALLKSVRYLLDYPEESAQITKASMSSSGLSIEQVKRRFELQRSYILGDENAKLMHVNPDHMDEMVSYYVQAGIIELSEDDE